MIEHDVTGQASGFVLQASILQLCLEWWTWPAENAEGRGLQPEGGKLHTDVLLHESRTQTCFFLCMFPTQSSSGGQTPILVSFGLLAAWPRTSCECRHTDASRALGLSLKQAVSERREIPDAGQVPPHCPVASLVEIVWNSYRGLDSPPQVCVDLKEIMKCFFIRGSSFSVFKWQAVVAFPSNVWSLWEEVKTGREGQVSS